jgi:hypothetical protein
MKPVSVEIRLTPSLVVKRHLLRTCEAQQFGDYGLTLPFFATHVCFSKLDTSLVYLSAEHRMTTPDRELGSTRSRASFHY